MSKYKSVKGEIDIKAPLCTTCSNYKKGECEKYPKGIPKEIQFEFKDCKYFKKIN